MPDGAIDPGEGKGEPGTTVKDPFEATLKGEIVLLP
jgi:hypothetical protein